MHPSLTLDRATFRLGTIAVLAALAACEAAPVESAKPASIAAMCLQPKGVSGNDADLITDAIVARLQQSGNFRVMERAQMDLILKEQGLSQTGLCNGAECAVEVGKILSVDRMMVGSVGLLGKTYTLNLRLVSVTTGEVVTSSLRSKAGTIDEVLTALVPESVGDLVRTIAVPAVKSEPKPVSGDLPVAERSGSRAHWGWWLAGGALVAGGGAAAAVLLMDGRKPAQTASTTTLNTTW